MIEKLERFNFSELLHAAQKNDYEKTGLLLMHIRYKELNENEIQEIIAVADKEEQKADELCISSLLVLRAALHEEGMGGSVDIPAAIRLYQRAIALKNPIAMINLANCERAQLPVNASEELIQLAEQSNCSWVLYVRGVMMQENKDYQQALAYYLRAAALNNPSAFNNLGCLYFNGQGFKIDYFKAFAYYNQGAALGHHKAIYNLACVYAQGHGCDSNFSQACYLFRFAYYLNKEEEVRQALESYCIHFVFDNYGKYHTYMALNAQGWYTKKLLDIFYAQPALFITLLLNDNLVTDDDRYHYLKIIMEDCFAKNIQPSLLIEADKTSVYYVEANKLLGEFCLGYVFKLQQNEELLNERLALLDLIPSSSPYYYEGLSVKADNLYAFQANQTNYLFMLALHEVDQIYVLLLQRAILKIIENKIAIKGTDELAVKQIAGLNNILDIAVKALTQPKTTQHSKLILPWKSDWQDYERHTVFAVKRRKEIAKMAPRLHDYIPQMKAFLLNLQEDIIKASTGFFSWFKSYSPSFYQLRQALYQQNIQALSDFQLLRLIERVEGALNNVSFAEGHKWENSFFSEHLIELEKISFELFQPRVKIAVSS